MHRLSKPGNNIFIFTFSKEYYRTISFSKEDCPNIKGIKLASYHRRGLYKYRYSKLGITGKTIRALFKGNFSLQEDNLRLLLFCVRKSRRKEDALRMFLDTLDLISFIKDNNADLLFCYSSKGFYLVSFIADFLGIKYEEYIGSGVQYFGEFGFELFAIIPYAYWLHVNRRLEFSASAKDTKCLYYFSPDHEEPSEKRSYVPITEYPAGAMTRFGADVPRFPELLDAGKWIPPPYKRVYENERFRWDKDICIICNKYTMEHISHAEGIAYYLTRKRGIINFLSIAALCEIVKLLSGRYQIIYNRPLPENIVTDHQESCDMNDFEILKDRFPGVLTLQELLKENLDLSYNQLQLQLFANCEHFISVQGGSSYLASYFGGKNIIFAKEGWEVQCNAYRNWFHRFSGARIFPVNNDQDLIDTVKREFL